VRVLTSVRKVARASSHVTLVNRILLAQLCGHPQSTQHRQRSRRLVTASAKVALRHEETLHAPLAPSHKLSWGTVTHRRSAVSGHARGLRLGLDRARCVSVTSSGYVPSPSQRR